MGGGVYNFPDQQESCSGTLLAQRPQPHTGVYNELSPRQNPQSRAHGHLQHEDSGLVGPVEGPHLQGHGGHVHQQHQQ